MLAVSAGNHAQAVAYHAQRMGIAGDDRHAALRLGVKVENTRGFGAEVVLDGDTFDDARVAGLKLAARARPHASSIPTTTSRVIAGQGTVALEMLAQQPAIDTLVVAIGGGGLIAGMATAAKALRPDIARRRRADRALPGGLERQARPASREPPGDDRRRHRRQVARRADAAA